MLDDMYSCFWFWSWGSWLIEFIIYHTYCLARTASILIAVSWPENARLWMLPVAVNVFVPTPLHFISFFFFLSLTLFFSFPLPPLLLYFLCSIILHIPVIQPPGEQNHGRLVWQSRRQSPWPGEWLRRTRTLLLRRRLPGLRMSWRSFTGLRR